MENLILVVVLILILGGAGLYVYRAKKSGQACIGCPRAKQCQERTCHCSCETKKKDV